MAGENHLTTQRPCIDRPPTPTLDLAHAHSLCLYPPCLPRAKPLPLDIPTACAQSPSPSLSGPYAHGRKASSKPKPKWASPSVRTPAAPPRPQQGSKATTAPSARLHPPSAWTPSAALHGSAAAFQDTDGQGQSVCSTLGPEVKEDMLRGLWWSGGQGGLAGAAEPLAHRGRDGATPVPATAHTESLGRRRSPTPPIDIELHPPALQSHGMHQHSPQDVSLQTSTVHPSAPPACQVIAAQEPALTAL